MLELTTALDEVLKTEGEVVGDKLDEDEPLALTLGRLLTTVGGRVS